MLADASAYNYAKGDPNYSSDQSGGFRDIYCTSCKSTEDMAAIGRTTNDDGNTLLVFRCPSKGCEARYVVAVGVNV